jgi:TolB-like protein/DNA-binding winged helix-turn-helix (wHTH) protein
MFDVQTFPTNPEAGGRFRLGELQVDPATGEIAGPGGTERVDPKVMAVLVVLAQSPGDLVTRAQLLERVWRGREMYDETLTQCIYQLRQHLVAAGGGNRYRKFVRTLPKRGYQLIAEVLPAGDSGQAIAGQAHRSTPMTLGLTALLLVLAGGWWWQQEWTERSAAAPTTPLPAAEMLPNSIAVLPFVDLSPEQDQRHFSDGIAEEVLNRLANYGELNVIARTSSFAFQGGDYAIGQISSLLGVEFILEGSVRKDGRKLRISARLVDAAARQRWNETFDRELGDVFAIQDEIAQAVVANVLPQVSAVRPAVQQPPDIEAYQHYLMGREILHSRVANFDNLAADEFRRAIETDPGYAAAYAELAIALTFASDREWYLREDPILQHKYTEAERAIEAALALKPELARSHAAQGFLYLQRRQTLAAEFALRRALALDPGMADGAYWLAAILAEQDNDEGWELVQRTARIDPLLPELNYDLAWGYAERGNYLQAENTYRRLLAVRKPATFTYAYARDFFADTGRFTEAVAIAKRMVLDSLLTPLQDLSVDHLAESYAWLGLWERAKSWSDRKETYLWYEAFTLEPQGRFREILALWADLREREGTALADQDRRSLRYFGHIQALASDYEQAIQTLEPVIGDSGPDRIFGDRRVTLAFAYLKTGALEEAQFLLDELEAEWHARELRGLLNYGPDLVEYALITLLRDDSNGAIKLLQRAVDTGWRGYFQIVNDPRWESLRSDERYQALLESIRKYVEAQRTEVEQLDREDGFTERVERVLASGEDGQTRQ